MWRKAFMTPLASLTVLDVVLVAAMLLALSAVIEGCGWLWLRLTNQAE